VDFGITLRFERGDAPGAVGRRAVLAQLVAVLAQLVAVLAQLVFALEPGDGDVEPDDAVALGTEWYVARYEPFGAVRDKQAEIRTARCAPAIPPGAFR
jgi:hypothetical protein